MERKTYPLIMSGGEIGSINFEPDGAFSGLLRSSMVKFLEDAFGDGLMEVLFAGNPALPRDEIMKRIKIVTQTKPSELPAYSVIELTHKDDVNNPQLFIKDYTREFAWYPLVYHCIDCAEDDKVLSETIENDPKYTYTIRAVGVEETE